MEQAIATLPECRRPTCHEPVAIGKSGEPLKDCETHRDKRPSAKARKAAALSVPAEHDDTIVEELGDGRIEHLPVQPNSAASVHRIVHDEPSFGTPRPAPKPTAKPQVAEPVVVLRADRNQVIVTLTAIGSTDAQSKAKYAARAAGHKVTGVASISGGENGSRKPSEWKVTLDLRAKTLPARHRTPKPGSKADFPVLSGGKPLNSANLTPEQKAAIAAARERGIHIRVHAGSGRFLAQAIVNGKPVYRYDADVETAERKLRAHLATL